MARIDPRSVDGAPVLVVDLRPHLARHFPGSADLAAALLRLERSDRLTLIRRDPAFGSDRVACLHEEQEELIEVIGVALR